MANRRSSPTFGSTRMLLEPNAWDNARLSWRLLRDSRVAPVLKVFVPIVVLLYLISPIDLIPDFLLGLGQFDDLGVLGAALLIAIRLLPRLAPAAVLSEHQTALGMLHTNEAPMTRSHPSGNVVDAVYRVREKREDREGRAMNAASERGL